MEQVSLFYQAEGLQSVQVIEINLETTVGALRDLLAEKHGWSTEVVLFGEDVDGELDVEVLVINAHPDNKLHAHRCRKIDVAVSFNGVTLPYEYGPSATIARIKHHAAIHGFHLTEDAAGEHVLQMKGTTTQPAPGTHIGALVVHPNCGIAFDLVPKMRVQGAFEVQG